MNIDGKAGVQQYADSAVHLSYLYCCVQRWFVANELNLNLYSLLKPIVSM